MEKKTAAAPVSRTPAPPLPLESAVSMKEPKTLSFAELAAFREAARKIISTHTHEEATRIFMGTSSTLAKVLPFEPAAKKEK